METKVSAEFEVVYHGTDDGRRLAAIAVRLPAAEDGTLHPLLLGEEQVCFQPLSPDWGDPDGEWRRNLDYVESETWDMLKQKVEICISAWRDALKAVAKRNREWFAVPEPERVVVEL